MGNLLEPLAIPNIALIIRNAPSLGVLQLVRNIEDGDSGAAHAVDLGD